MKTSLLLLSAFSFSALAADPLPNDNSTTETAQLDTVKVTADFRQLDLMQIPSSITVVGEDDIQNRNADHLESILSLAPNVNFASGASRGRFFQIRGIGERSQFIDPVNPSVGLIIDGIDMTGLGGAATLFDIEQVEILRGPQGTAFGANALAGAINIKSKQPTKETEGYVQAKLGNYNTQGLGGAISGSLAKNVQARFAINQFKTDGYMENVFLNRKDTNNIDETVARVQLTWQVNKDNDLNISLFSTDIDNGYDAFTLDNTRKSKADEPGQDTLDTLATSIKWNNRSNHYFSLETLISASATDSIYSFDEDWVDQNYDSINGYTSFDEYIREQEKYTADVRLISNQNSMIFNNTDWVIGIYSSKKDEALDRNKTNTAKNLNSNVSITSYAFYTELTTKISNMTSISYGLRIEDWSNNYRDSNNILENKNETLWGGKISIERLVNAHHLIYGSLARGYKSGGINSNTEIPEDNRTFDTEYNYSFETGIKSSLLDDALLTRISAFYIQRENQQVKNSTSKIEDGDVIFNEFYDNATRGINYGLELESDWQLSQKISWKASIGYLNTEFKDYSYTDEFGIFYDNNGRDQGHAPQWSVATDVNININKNLSVSIMAEGKDRFYLSDSQDVQSNAYGLLHANIKYNHENLTISLNGRNLTDKDYTTRGFGFGNDPKKGENGYEPSKYIQFGEPRLISLNARYDF